ncbi:hypothetical protein G6F46_014904 [Rhizopus delemar]|nr:hypothetical protein G6F46_014904 [Rhizopus delemar]
MQRLRVFDQRVFRQLHRDLSAGLRQHLDQLFQVVVGGQRAWRDVDGHRQHEVAFAPLQALQHRLPGHPQVHFAHQVGLRQPAQEFHWRLLRAFRAGGAQQGLAAGAQSAAQ